MEEKEIFEKVKDIIIKVLDADEDKVLPESRIVDDFNAQSIDLITLVLEIEDEFGGHVNDEDIPGLSTVGDVVGYIKTKMLTVSQS